MFESTDPANEGDSLCRSLVYHLSLLNGSTDIVLEQSLPSET